MNRSVFRSMWLMVLCLVITDASFGSTAVVIPLSAVHPARADDNYGVLIGTNHVVMSFSRNGQSQAPGRNQSNEMEWHLEEVTQGKRSLAVQIGRAHV